MRTSLSILFLTSILFGMGYWYLEFASVCRVPIAYHIGTVDPRFHIQADELTHLAAQAESLWETKTERDLFMITDTEGLPINLIYDERQEKANDEATLREVLEKKEGMSDSVRIQYENLLNAYGELKRSYDERVARYEDKLAAYNNEVSEWNEKGGAPPAIFAELERTQRTLDTEADALNATVKKINGFVTQMNALSERGNNLIADYNEVVETYNDRFSEGDEFTQGDYQREAITIYQFDSRDELALVLAHEFGHALGVGHVTDEHAIMYHLMEHQSIETGVVEADAAAFVGVCGTADSLTNTLRLIVRGIISIF